MWICTEGHPAVAGDHFCRQCGGVVHRRCAQCHTYASDADRVCAACGAALEDGAPPAGSAPPPPPPGYTTPGAWSQQPGSAWPQPPGWQQQPGWQQGSGWQQGGWQQSPGWPPQGAAWQPQVPLSAFGAPLAGWWTRVGAFLLDFFVLLIPTLVVQAIARGASSSTNGSGTSTGASVAALLAGTVISGLYFGILNGVGRGQTLGNMAAGIGVRDAQTGAVIGLGRGLLRWLARYLLYFFFVPGLLSDLWPLWDGRNQTLADKAANTVMIKLR